MILFIGGRSERAAAGSYIYHSLDCSDVHVGFNGYLIFFFFSLHERRRRVHERAAHLRLAGAARADAARAPRAVLARQTRLCVRLSSFAPPPAARSANLTLRTAPPPTLCNTTRVRTAVRVLPRPPRTLATALLSRRSAPARRHGGSHFLGRRGIRRAQEVQPGSRKSAPHPRRLAADPPR